MNLLGVFRRKDWNGLGRVVSRGEFSELVKAAGLPTAALREDDAYQLIPIDDFREIVKLSTHKFNPLPWRKNKSDCDKRARLVEALVEQKYAELTWHQEPPASLGFGRVVLHVRGAAVNHVLLFHLDPSGRLTLYEDLTFRPVVLDVDRYFATYY